MTETRDARIKLAIERLKAELTKLDHFASKPEASMLPVQPVRVVVEALEAIQPRPIEEAPKDGTPIIGIMFHHRTPFSLQLQYSNRYNGFLSNDRTLHKTHRVAAWLPFPSPNIWCDAIPQQLASGRYLHGGGEPVTFLCVDWFNSRSEMPKGSITDDFDLVEFLKAKKYRRTDRAYLVLDDTDVDTMIIPKEPSQ